MVAHDLHPDYLSTRYALEREGVERVAVQHHHAHLAACLAEHGEDGPAVGAIFDGAGLGPDETVWGGELLLGGLHGFERRGLLFPVRLPGGDRATLEPWRMACAWLVAATGEEAPDIPAALRGRSQTVNGARICELARTGRQLASHHQRRAPVRRRLRAVRDPRPRDLRGPGRGRARRAGRRRRDAGRMGCR